MSSQLRKSSSSCISVHKSHSLQNPKSLIIIYGLTYTGLNRKKHPSTHVHFVKTISLNSDDNKINNATNKKGTAEKKKFTKVIRGGAGNV